MKVFQVKAPKSFILITIFTIATLIIVTTAIGCQTHTHTLDWRTLSAIVPLGCEGQDGAVQRVGTGVAILHGGKEYLATALHVIDQCDMQPNIGVGKVGRPKWTTVGMDKETDIAVLTTDQLDITSNHPLYAEQQPAHATLGYAIGFPSGNEVTFMPNPYTGNALPIAVPIVTNITNVNGTHHAGGYLNKGFSGGAIVTQRNNGEWHVVGIVTHKTYANASYYYEDPETGETKLMFHTEHAGLTKFTEIGRVIRIIEDYRADDPP